MIPTIGQMLARTVHRVPDKRALICDEHQLTYRELNAQVNQIAHGFQQSGIREDDRVALLFHNSIPLIELLLALAKTGITGIPLNFRLHARELSSIIEQSDATVLFAGEEFENIISGLQPFPSSLRSFISVEKPPGKAGGFYKTARSQPDTEPALCTRPDRDSFVMYTSGTTGFPWGVVLTHGNHFWNTVNYTVAYGMGEDDVELGLAPLFHSATLGRMITCICNGATFVTSRQFIPESALELIARYHVTSVTQSPTMYASLLDVRGADRYDTGSVKRVVSGAAPLFPAIREGLSTLFPQAGVFDLYGLTEASPGVSILIPSDPPEKITSVGRPMMSVKIRVADEHAMDVPAGECGEILCRGPNVMKGYYRNEEATREVLKNGWLHTGDMGQIDKDGYLYLTGRKKEMIIRGGEKIYSADVERVLCAHPGIAEAAVIGVPDDYWGECVKVVVVPRAGISLTEQEVIAYCGQRLAHYKKPASVSFVKNLPRNAAGKVMKSELKKLFSPLTPSTWCLQRSGGDSL